MLPVGGVRRGVVGLFGPEPGALCPAARSLTRVLGQTWSYMDALTAGTARGARADPAGHVPLREEALTELSAREREVARMLVDGHRVRTAARALDLSEHTVRNHLKSIFRKPRVHSQVELLDALRFRPARG